MITKKECQHLIDIYSVKFIKQLKLTKWKIKIHVYKSGSKKLQKLGMSKSESTYNCGISYISFCGKSADVVLYYNEIKDRKDAIATIYHELLHVAFAKLCDFITLRKSASNREEERLIRVLESMFMEYTNK